MSSNDSGGSPNGGSRNPWDRQPEAGPPDLVEILKGLKRKIFGGKRVGQGSDPSVEPPSTGREATSIGVILAIALALWAASGCYLVGPAEKAVITRFGHYERIAGEGPNYHLPWPIEWRQIVNTQEVLSISDRSRMLTQDAALVDINIAVQYRRYDPRAFVFNIVDPQSTLSEASESAIREVIGQTRLELVLEQGRQEIALKTRALIQHTLDGYHAGIEVIGVNLQDVAVPEQVAPSQKDVIKAREDKDRLRVEAETYRNDILPKARGTAERQLLDAEAYRQQIVAEAEGEGSRFAQLAQAYEKSPALTRQRLYLETMEDVYAHTGKVFVDAKGNGSNFYLPLDKLMEKKAPEPKREPTLPEVTVSPGVPVPTPAPAAGEPGDGRGRSRGSRG
jgi:modulator of FtsH protease HflK